MLRFWPVYLGLRGWQLSQEDVGSGTRLGACPLTTWVGVDQWAAHAGHDL